MAKVGRPPAVDKHGVVIQKSLVNVTIPTKLANFLKEKGINRSKLFTEVVKKRYNNEICANCYGEDIKITAVGSYCEECRVPGRGPTKWIKLNNCENCGIKYQPGYNMFAQDGKIEGCQDCIPPKERT